MIFDMDELISQEIRAPFKIVTTLKYGEPYEDEHKPEWVLAKDKKFIGLLQGYGKLVR